MKIFPDTLDLQMIRGRWLSAEEVQRAQYVAVINQRLARDFFADRNPLGQQLKVKAFKKPSQPPQDVYFQIIGVVHDVKNAGLQQPALPMLFVPVTVRGGFILLLKTTVSVMAHTDSLQTHEIGIRVALGARPGSIVGMTLATGARLIAVGIALGLGASFELTRFLKSQIWGIPRTDPWTFAAVIALIVTVGLGACVIPARRAMRVDPVVALRHE